VAYRKFLKKTGRGFHEVQEEEQERLGEISARRRRSRRGWQEIPEEEEERLDGDKCKEEQERMAGNNGGGGGKASTRDLKMSWRGFQ
jgi:hypothetical protein